MSKEGEEIKNPYSDIGEKWLLKCIGDKKAELVEFLKLNNITLVFELIDSSFEEHVIEYSAEDDGLYLHGINKNTIEFQTWPSEKVYEFANQFNFKQVNYKIYNDLIELKNFVDECNGYYNGKAIEGWVVRCKTKEDNTFFFKMKYDEPYLMYREWREATNAYINKKVLKYHYLKTYSYMEWIKEKYETNKELFLELKNKRGIIRLRNLYLEDTKDGNPYVTSLPKKLTKEEAKYILILPIGCIGFGKTTVGEVLQILYNIGHVQSDNINKKKPAPEFINNVCKEFDTHNIVMADKNNHLRQHRGTLCEKVKSIYPHTLWVVALYWNIETVSENEILEFTRERIEKRGENHQTLTPVKVGNYPSIIKTFLNNFENLDLSSSDDSLIDEVIEVEFKESSKSIVQKIIKQLNLPPVSSEKIDEALQQVYNIKVTNSKPAKKLKALYYGINFNPLNISGLVEKYFELYAQQYPKTNYLAEIQKIFKNKNFMQKEHVTLAYRKTASAEEFDYYIRLIEGSSSDSVTPQNKVKSKNAPKVSNPSSTSTPKPIEVNVGISRIVWNDKLITLPIDFIDTDKLWKGEAEEEEGQENNRKTKIHHITIACSGSSKPFDSNILLEKMEKYYKEKEKESSLLEKCNKERATVVDESNLLDSSLIKPQKIITGPQWKILEIEPIQFKGVFAPFYY